jgi:hypothetical protein
LSDGGREDRLLGDQPYTKADLTQRDKAMALLGTPVAFADARVDMARACHVAKLESSAVDGKAPLTCELNQYFS